MTDKKELKNGIRKIYKYSFKFKYYLKLRCICLCNDKMDYKV